MKGSDIGQAILGGWVLAVMIWYVWMCIMGVLLPMAIISGMRSLRGIQRQLEAMNERGAAERVGAPGRLIAP